MSDVALRSGSPDDHTDITSRGTYLEGLPHATFERMRREEPVSWVAEDGSGFWALTKYDDVVAVSRDYNRFTASRGIRIEEMDPDELEARRSMMEFDPPEHTRLRRLVQPGFTPKVTATYEEAFRRLVRLVLDGVLPLGVTTGVGERRHRGDPEGLGRDHALPPHGHRRHRHQGQCHWPRATAWPCGTRRPTTTATRSMIRTRSTCPASRTHLTFGTGRHKCLGASLAQLDVRVFSEEFLDRVSSFGVGKADLLRSNFIRGIKHLPVGVST